MHGGHQSQTEGKQRDGQNSPLAVGGSLPAKQRARGAAQSDAVAAAFS